MKRIIVLLLCAVIAAASMIPCFAETSEGEALVLEFLKYYKYETDQIKLTVSEQYGDWSEYLGDDPDDIRYDLMHQIYYLNMKDTVDAYDNDGSFGANISEKYYWIVPNYVTGSEVQVVRNEDAEHGWAIRRGTHCMKNIQSAYPDTVYGIEAIYDNVLEKYPQTDKLSFRFIYEELHDIHLMYFVCEGEEYVTPYFSSKDITWLKNAEIYAAADYIELVRANTVDETSSAALDEGKIDTETIYMNYIVIGTVAVVGIALVAVITAKNRKRASTDDKTE